MRRLAAVMTIVLVLSGAAAGQGAPPLTAAERDYIATRDAAIAAIKARIDAKASDAEISAADDKALADLAARLRAIIGPVSIAGFGEAKSNLDTLQQELGFGYLDGLVVRSADSKASVVVTTGPLFAAWLRGHRNWWEKSAPMPQTLAAAVRTEAFYTQALSTDAAMVSYGELAVKKPAGAAFAFAILGARTQDQSPDAPDQIFVTVVKGGRVFVATVPLKQAITPHPSCAALHAEFHKRAEKLADAYRASELKDQAAFDRSIRLESEGDERMRRCVGQKMTPPQKAAAREQAEAVAETMAAR